MDKHDEVSMSCLSFWAVTGCVGRRKRMWSLALRLGGRARLPVHDL